MAKGDRFYYENFAECTALAKKAANYLVECDCDPNYPIVPSYTYNSGNLDTLISMTDEKYHKQMIAYDNLDPAIACHWGPNAFGYIFIAGNDHR